MKHFMQLFYSGGVVSEKNVVVSFYWRQFLIATGRFKFPKKNKANNTDRQMESKIVNNGETKCTDLLKSL